jgi:hypothetical protein
MPISAANLAGGGTTNATSITTASVTSSLGRVAVMAVFNLKTAPQEIPACSGWTVHTTFTNGDQDRATLLTRLGDGSVGTHDITFNGVEHAIIDYIIDEFVGVDTGGTNGSAAIRRAVGNAGSYNGPQWTLPGFQNKERNTAYVACSNDAELNDPATGYTALGVVLVGRYWDSAYKTPTGEDVSPTMDAPTGNWTGIAAEMAVLSPIKSLHKPYYIPASAARML